VDVTGTASADAAAAAAAASTIFATAAVIFLYLSRIPLRCKTCQFFALDSSNDSGCRNIDRLEEA
jgi:hypothetical protein